MHFLMPCFWHLLLTAFLGLGSSGVLMPIQAQAMSSVKRPYKAAYVALCLAACVLKTLPAHCRFCGRLSAKCSACPPQRSLIPAPA